MNDYTSVVFYSGPNYKHISVYDDHYKAIIKFFEDSVGSYWKIGETQVTETVIHYYNDKK